MIFRIGLLLLCKECLAVFQQQIVTDVFGKPLAKSGCVCLCKTCTTHATAQLTLKVLTHMIPTAPPCNPVKLQGSSERGWFHVCLVGLWVFQSMRAHAEYCVRES